MTFARMIILAFTTAILVNAKSETKTGLAAGVLVIVVVAYIAWCFTTDPLPGAMDRALDDYAKKLRKR